MIFPFLSFQFSACKSPLESVIGIQWGDYCGSKSHQAPLVQRVQTLNYPAKRIITSASSLSAYLCQENICILTEGVVGNINKQIGMLSWGNNNILLQVKATNSSTKTYFNPMRPDRVTLLRVCSWTRHFVCWWLVRYLKCMAGALSTRQGKSRN